MGACDWLAAWDAVVAAGGTAAIEEFWLNRLDEGVGDGESFVEALRRLRSASKKALAATLLELAADASQGERAWQARKRFLCELLRLGIGDAERARASLEEAVRHLWAGRPSLEKLLQHFPLRGSRKPLESLETLELWLTHDVGGVFAMAGRGAGRVSEASPQLGVLRLDFAREKRVPVPIDAAARYLTPLPPRHFLRRRLEEPQILAQEVAADPPAALEALLASLGTALTVAELRATLEGLVSDEQWAPWWSKARKHPRLLAVGSGSRVAYRMAAAGGPEEEIRAQFAAADLGQRIELARRHGARSRELGAEMARELLVGAGQAGVEIAQAWEALHIAARLGAGEPEVSAGRAVVVARAGASGLLDSLTDAQQRELALQFLRTHTPDGWIETLSRRLENESHPRLLGMIAGALVEAGEIERLRSFLDQAFLHPQKLPAAILWACEETGAGTVAALLDERHTGALLVRLVELAERKEFSPLRARLKEVLSPRGLAGRIVQDRLTVEQGRRLQQILDKPGALVEERSWLRRAVIARFPELREERRDDSVPALASTAARLQAELRNLLEKEIPEVLKAIQIAREHGDLSENFEYHAARARQELLSAKAAQLQGDLSQVKVIDPARIDPARVRVGTRVILDGEGERLAYAILGPYEANPEACIVSHASELAQAVLEKAVGETVTVSGRRVRIAAIERYEET
ncbi:MAG: GreA/GreB family elongation factor [Acidobacteriota bacterium]